MDKNSYHILPYITAENDQTSSYEGEQQGKWGAGGGQLMSPCCPRSCFLYCLVMRLLCSLSTLVVVVSWLVVHCFVSYLFLSCLVLSCLVLFVSFSCLLSCPLSQLLSCCLLYCLRVLSSLRCSLSCFLFCLIVFCLVLCLVFLPLLFCLVSYLVV